MAEERRLFIDSEPKSDSSSRVEGRAEKPVCPSDSTFRFNFFPDGFPAPQEETCPSDVAEPNPISFTGQGSAFAFNFQIPAAVEDMEATETTDASSSPPGSQKCVQKEKPSGLPEANASLDSNVQLKTKKKKKKKKSGKNKKPSSTEPQQKPAEESEGGEELSAEQQLNRQLDWCIEQLELGMRSQKGTPKQKEETSRSLKTLRSAKAPLAKKRQVMRAMSGDYRKKMEEEKSKQFKLIQTEIASAQVKVVSDSPKKSVFRRRTEVKAQTAATEGIQQQAEGRDTEPTLQTQEGTSTFVFVPSTEEFRFNFF
ncbi:UPF0488 protein C8orf33 homolog [Embiotoca jacksoni]|uniref:UPF0488 protein C8orf33 homolog n=1 Tax=Embiotoca jacksoni TaxID=100190 RepID=UPI003703E583